MKSVVLRLPSFAFLGCLLCSPVYASDDKLGVELSNKEGSIRVVVLNASNQKINLDSRLANGPNLGLWPIYFDVHDAHGRSMDFIAKIGPGSELDRRDLLPGNLIGIEIPLCILAAEYGLKRGIYNFSAAYNLTSTNGTVLHAYRSNVLAVTIYKRSQCSP